MYNFFPFKFYSLSPDYPFDAMEALMNYKPTFIYKDYDIGNINRRASEVVTEHSGKIAPFKVSGYDYPAYGELSDCFNEPSRVQARVKSKTGFYPSPLEYWNANKEAIGEKFGLVFDEEWYRSHPDEVGQARQYLWKLTDPYRETKVDPPFREAGTFRITNIISMVKYFYKDKKVKILDMCAGWGDRLLGSIALSCHYTGIDPNLDNHTGYNNIIDAYSDLIAEEGLNITLIASPYEEAEIKGKFDVMFTSPPYYDFEAYRDEENQSIVRYKDLDDWYNNFLLFSAVKTLDLLNEGGFMIYVINDAMSTYTERFVKDVSSICQFVTVVGYGENAIQPMWIWKKV